MARRRKLEAPSAADLDRLEEEFRRETPMKGAMAPIAQVAADAAGQSPVVGADVRAQHARDAADAEVLRQSLSKGLVMQEVSLSDIDLEDMIRDRIKIDETELQELRRSIESNGLRLPVELYELKKADADKKFGVVSGFRRILAVKGLLEQTGRAEFASIKALLKPLETMPDAFVAMVEENEVRSQLSHFERGRIAVISTQNGAFDTVEDAVSKLFASASKAKRSKVRSFAHVFEELGDLMLFAEQLTEKQGLRLASTLRMGHVQELREALAQQDTHGADDEWACMLRVIERAERGPKDTSRGGRPRANLSQKTAKERLDIMRNGRPVAIQRERDDAGFLLRFEGAVDEDLVELAMRELQKLLSD